MKCSVLSFLVAAFAVAHCSEGDQFLREIQNPKRRTHLTIRGKFEDDDAVPDAVEVVPPKREKLRVEALEQRLTQLSEKLGRGNDGFGAKLNPKEAEAPVPVSGEKKRKRKKIVRKRVRTQNRKNVNGVDQVATEAPVDREIPEVPLVAVEMPGGEMGKFAEAVPLDMADLPKEVRDQIAALAVGGQAQAQNGNATSVANQYYVRVYSSPFLSRDEAKDTHVVSKLEQPIVQKNSHQVIQVVAPQTPEPNPQVYEQPQEYVQPPPVQFVPAPPQVVYQNNPQVVQTVADQPSLVETPVLREAPQALPAAALSVPPPHSQSQQHFYRTQAQPLQQSPPPTQQLVLHPLPPQQSPPQQLILQPLPQQQTPPQTQQPSQASQSEQQSAQPPQQFLYQPQPQQQAPLSPQPQQIVYQQQPPQTQPVPPQPQQPVAPQQQLPPQSEFQQPLPVQQSPPQVQQQTIPVRHHVVYPTIIEPAGAPKANTPERNVIYPTFEEKISEPIIVQHIVQPSYTKIPAIQKAIANSGSMLDQKPTKQDIDSEVIYPPSIPAPAVVKSRHRTVFSPVENPQPGQQVYTLNEIHAAETSYFHNTPFAQVNY